MTDPGSENRKTSGSSSADSSDFESARSSESNADSEATSSSSEFSQTAIGSEAAQAEFDRSSDDKFFSKPDSGGLDDREQFIPIGRSEVFDSLPGISQCSQNDREKFREFSNLVDAYVHHEYHEQHRELQKLYQPLDPDSEYAFSESTIESCNRNSKKVFDRLEYVLEKANYRKLSVDELEVAVENASVLGIRLKVHFDMFEDLHVYARGNRVERWKKRTWWKFFREEEFDVDVYQRLVIAFRLREHKQLQKDHQTDVVYLKSFKTIPHSDMHALLPGTQVRMSLLDQGRIILPTLSGLAFSLFKLFRFLMLMTVFATIFKFFTIIGLLIGVGLYIAKGFFSYFQTKDKYLLNLTRHLYFQNLDNNSGVMFRVLNEAESQDFREIIYAYYMLWRFGKKGLKEDELDDVIEKNLKRTTNLEIDFEVGDAVAKLEALKIANQRDGKWFAIDIDQAFANIDRLWDDAFDYSSESNPD